MCDILGGLAMYGRRRLRWVGVLDVCTAVVRRLLAWCVVHLGMCMNSFEEMRINIRLEKQWQEWNLDGKSMKNWYFGTLENCP